MALRIKSGLNCFIKYAFNKTNRNICIYCNTKQGFQNKTTDILDSANRSASKLPIEKNKPKNEKISRAMLSFLERQENYEKTIKEKEVEFNLGKRHLAKIMGLDPHDDKFEQTDINKAIAYLLPSGLHQKEARPFLKHPSTYYPKIKELDFDREGRPLNFLFYTLNQKYFEIISLATEKILELEKKLDELKNLEENLKDLKHTKYDDKGTKWIDESSLSKLVDNTIATNDYLRFVNVMERLVNNPLSKSEEEFIGKFRMTMQKISNKNFRKELKYYKNGTAFAKQGAHVRTAHVNVTLTEGDGKINIMAPEGEYDILFFQLLKHREQLLFPFKITDKINKYDIRMSVNNGGMSCIAKAARYAISKALCCFSNENDIEKMRLAGLLTADPRIKERKKPGREGARRRYTWKKR